MKRVETLQARLEASKAKLEVSERKKRESHADAVKHLLLREETHLVCWNLMRSHKISGIDLVMQQKMLLGTCVRCPFCF